MVLYVGKAKNLRARVASYFQTRKHDRYQIRLLMRRVATIESIVTDTEKEALLLEHTLIRRYRPRYNILFRDDRSFLSLRVTTQHPYPGIYLTRKVTQDGATYFGPYTSALACRETALQITRAFRLRTCHDHDFANRSRPCMQYQIGQCTAPCVGYVDAAAYGRQVQEALWLLQGRRSELVARLELQMRAAAEAERFEEAARTRDLLRNIAVTVEPQHVVRHAAVDRDYVGWAIDEGRGAVAVLEVREGKVVGRNGTAVPLGGATAEACVASFLLQYYQPPRTPPPVICVPMSPALLGGCAEILRERRGDAVRLQFPRRGPEARLLRLAATNARATARTQRTLDEEWGVLAAATQRALHLPQPPTTIECVDISNWQGQEAVGALVCFVEGIPAKQRYRRFNIRTVQGLNDYAMMREVLQRRLLGDLPRPDLLLVDGGRGHLQIAARVLAELECLDLPLAAIAKPTERETIDKVYLPGRKNPLALKPGHPVLHLLQRLRDEAHRFGITRVRQRIGRVAAPKKSER